MSAGSPYDSEEQWRRELIRNPQSFEGFNRYGRLLGGAKLFAEARQYIARCIEMAEEAGEMGWATSSRETYASFAEGERDCRCARLLSSRPAGVQDEVMDHEIGPRCEIETGSVSRLDDRFEQTL